MRRDHPSLYPLRRIVGHTDRGGDVLECMHDLPEASDIYGPRPAQAHRRCPYCWKEFPDQVKEHRRRLAAVRKEKRRRKSFEDQRAYFEKLRGNHAAPVRGELDHSSHKGPCGPGICE